MVGISTFSDDGTDVIKFAREFTFGADHQSSRNESVDKNRVYFL